MAEETTGGDPSLAQLRLWNEATGPILAETAEIADAIARIEPGVPVMTPADVGDGAGVRLVAAATQGLADLAAGRNITAILMSGAGAAERLRWALDNPGSPPLDDAFASARAWLSAVRDEEARTFTRRLAAEAAADEHRERHIRALEENIAGLEAHIAAIKATRAWRVAATTRRTAGRLRPAPKPGTPAVDPAPPPRREEPSRPERTALALRVDLVTGVPTRPPAAEGLDVAVFTSPAAHPEAHGDAAIVAILDPDAELLVDGLRAAVAELEGAAWDAVICAERAFGGEPPIEVRGAWSELTARSWAAASGLVVIRRDLIERHGGLRPEAGWDAAHDLLLRAGSDAAIQVVAEAGCIRHPPIGPRRLRPSTAAVLNGEYSRIGTGDGTIEASRRAAGVFRRRGPLRRCTVSVIVPTRDRPDLLGMVLDGLRSTDWQPLEVVIVDHQSRDPEAVEILRRTPHRVVAASFPFNFSRLANRGAAAASGDVLIFLNNDVELTDPDWLEPLVDLAIEEGAGPVGALLRYPDGTIQHCGIAVGSDGPVHPLRGISPDMAPAGLALVPGERTAVTGACLAITSATFGRLGGFEPLLAHGYNDVDLCLRAWRAGYRVTYTPFTDLVHHESASRGTVVSPEVVADWLLMRSRWPEELAGRDRWWPAGVTMETGEPQPR